MVIASWLLFHIMVSEAQCLSLFRMTCGWTDLIGCDFLLGFYFALISYHSLQSAVNPKIWGSSNTLQLLLTYSWELVLIDVCTPFPVDGFVPMPDWLEVRIVLADDFREDKTADEYKRFILNSTPGKLGLNQFKWIYDSLRPLY